MDNQTILQVWNKGTPIAGNNPNEWRQDECGAWIGFQFYGNRDNQYGWEIDHITSQDHGGGDNLSNLRPLHWRNNLSKSSGRLTCSVKANGVHNALYQ